MFIYQSMFDYDAIIVGGGIIGSSCGYQLAKSGKSTLVLEQYELGHSLGSSHGRSRFIRYSHSPAEVYLPLVIDAFKQWKQLQELAGEQLIMYVISMLLQVPQPFSQNGVLWLGDALNTKKRSSALSQFAIPHEVLVGKQIRKRFPHLHYDDQRWHALYEPGAGTMLAEKCLKGVQKQFIAKGGVIHEKERVLRIICDTEDKIVEVYTQVRKYTTKVLVVAAGAWLSTLLPELPIKATPQLVGVCYWNIKEGIGSVHKAPPGKESPNVLVTSVDDELYLIPCVDFEDKVKFGVHLGVAYDPNNRKSNAEFRSPEWAKDMPAKHIAEHMPYLDCSRPAVQDLCVYTMTDDQNMIIDRHPSHLNILIAGGMSGTGFKFSLTVGKIISQMVDGTAEFDLSPFKIDRRIAPHTKGKL